ncbi:hypothetical protein H0V99_04175 [Candidatus Saccharibacteria bacterium]|nr:hypothetical protein [Candidatus Saccharibacteria bacterium]
MNDKQDKIISTNEMRKLLGKEYASNSDREVGTVTVQLELMAEIVIKQIKKELLGNKEAVPKST